MADWPLRVTGLTTGISVFEPGALSSMPPGPERDQLREMINTFGKLSAVAQGLSHPITDFERTAFSGQYLYLASRNAPGGGVRLQGLLKTGSKTLFIRSITGTQREITPTCVLDFYVHESCQRSGIGRGLFETFLAHERLKPAELGYDRPSPKLISFLAKHYALVDYLPQANNFVVFDDYFRTQPARIHGQGGRPVLAVRPLTAGKNRSRETPEPAAATAMDRRAPAGRGAPQARNARAATPPTPSAPPPAPIVVSPSLPWSREPAIPATPAAFAAPLVTSHAVPGLGVIARVTGPSIMGPSVMGPGPASDGNDSTGPGGSPPRHGRRAAPDVLASVAPSSELGPWGVAHGRRAAPR